MTFICTTPKSLPAAYCKSQDLEHKAKPLHKRRSSNPSADHPSTCQSYFDLYNKSQDFQHKAKPLHHRQAPPSTPTQTRSNPEQTATMNAASLPRAFFNKKSTKSSDQDPAATRAALIAAHESRNNSTSSSSSTASRSTTKDRTVVTESPYTDAAASVISSSTTSTEAGLLLKSKFLPSRNSKKDDRTPGQKQAERRQARTGMRTLAEYSMMR